MQYLTEASGFYESEVQYHIDLAGTVLYCIICFKNLCLYGGITIREAYHCADAHLVSFVLFIVFLNIIRCLTDKGRRNAYRCSTILHSLVKKFFNIIPDAVLPKAGVIQP